jgi:hypothetical protein
MKGHSVWSGLSAWIGGRFCAVNLVTEVSIKIESQSTLLFNRVNTSPLASQNLHLSLLFVFHPPHSCANACLPTHRGYWE